MELTQKQYKKIEKSLPKKRGNWQMAYDILAPLQAERIIHINVDVKRGYAPIVPTKRSYKEQWEYDKELYKRRNEVERFFCRLKCFSPYFYSLRQAGYYFRRFYSFIHDLLIL